MTNQITRDELLDLITVKKGPDGAWCIRDVLTHVYGDVIGDIAGNAYGDIKGTFVGTIDGRRWEYIETPVEKLKRLIGEGADRATLESAINQLEENS